MIGRYCSVREVGLWSDDGLWSPSGLQERPACLWCVAICWYPAPPQLR